MRNKILLLGSGELGKEVVIALQRLGQYVIAVDSYPNAPAMQVAHDFEVIKKRINNIKLKNILARASGTSTNAWEPSSMDFIAIGA